MRVASGRTSSTLSRLPACARGWIRTALTLEEAVTVLEAKTAKGGASGGRTGDRRRQAGDESHRPASQDRRQGERPRNEGLVLRCRRVLFRWSVVAADLATRRLKGMRRVPLKARNARARRTGLPGRDDVMNYLEQSGGALSEHDLARAFGVKGRDRLRLKRMLRDLEEDGRGALAPAPVRRAAERRRARSRRTRCRWRAARPPRLRARGHAAAHPAPCRRRPRGGARCRRSGARPSVLAGRRGHGRDHPPAAARAARVWSACCSVGPAVCSWSRPAMASAASCWCASRTAWAPARATSWSPSG